MKKLMVCLCLMVSGCASIDSRLVAQLLNDLDQCKNNTSQCMQFAQQCKGQLEQAEVKAAKTEKKK